MSTGVYILKNTPGGRGNISQCNLGEKYEKAKGKRGKNVKEKGRRGKGKRGKGKENEKRGSKRLK